MEEQVARFVARDDKPPLPAPRNEASYWGTARKNLFATPTDTILTLFASFFIVYFGWKLLNWAWFDAVFEGSDRTACLVEDGGHGGACWAFVKARFEQFIYGTYPIGERWRVNLVFALLAVLVVPLAMPSAPFKRLNAILLFAVFPVVTLVLLTGGEFTFGSGTVTFLILLAAIAAVARASGRREASWLNSLLRTAAGLALASFLLLLGSNVVDSSDVRLLGTRFPILVLLALLFALGSAAAAMLSARGEEGSGSVGQLLMPLFCVLALLFVMTADFGLPDVRTSLWGGLLVTLVVALSGIAASLPLGILLALGRRSNLPAVRFLSIVFIEFWRGVPLITVLFMANFMLPLLMPEGVNFNQLLRVLIGVALFSAAYMAEVVRGGLQAIPKGQYEGADAMALTYWQKMRMIILPQALTLVIPGIVNTFIGLFKDTSLVYIIGLADLLGTVRRGFTDPNWITPATPASGLVFAAFIFWLFCFGMSRYSIFMERRLDTGHKR